MKVLRALSIVLFVASSAAADGDYWWMNQQDVFSGSNSNAGYGQQPQQQQPHRQQNFNNNNNQGYGSSQAQYGTYDMMLRNETSGFLEKTINNFIFFLFQAHLLMTFRRNVRRAPNA